jgi:hypothetical protein
MLCLLAALHYGYAMFDSVSDRAQWWNLSGAVARSALLIALAWRWRGPVLLVVGWWLAEEAMIAGCSAWFMVSPWTVPAGQDQCSSLLAFDLGKIGAAVMVLLLVWMMRRIPD